MPKTYTNRGKFKLTNGTLSSATKQISAHTGTGPTAAAAADFNFVSDLVTSNTEVAVAGYARAGITSTFTENDTNDRVDITWTSPSFGASLAAGATITTVGCFDSTPATDATRELLWVDVPASSIATNGSGITYTSAADTLT